MGTKPTKLSASDEVRELIEKYLTDQLEIPFDDLAWPVLPCNYAMWTKINDRIVSLVPPTGSLSQADTTNTDMLKIYFWEDGLHWQDNFCSSKTYQYSDPDWFRNLEKAVQAWLSRQSIKNTI